MIRSCRSILFYASLLALTALFMGAATAQAQSPQHTLNQYVAELQKSPNDYALREKIINHVQTMKPAPAVPDEARRFMNRGMAAAEGAKTESDYRDAIQEFQKTVNIAPWLGSGYRNLAVMQDKAGQYAQAVQNLKLFLLTNPPAADAEAAKTLIDKIEYRQEKAAKESSPAAMAEKKRQEEGAFLKKIDGARYKYHYSGSRDAGYWIFDIRGNQVTKGFVITSSRFSPEDVGRYERDGMAPLNGREFTLTSGRFSCSLLDNSKQVEKGRISDDGESITTQVCNETRTYRRER